MGFFDFLFGGSKSESDPAESMPQNDAERWAVAVYAIWSEFSNGSYKYFGGFEKNQSNASMAKRVLDRDWLIGSKESAIDMINYLLDEKNNAGKAAGKAAFNYGCAGNMAARCYLAGFLTREEMMAEASRVAKVIRENFHSWEEFAQHYIEGVGMELGSADKQNEVRQIYQRLVSLPDSPYSVDWNTPF